MRIAYIINHLGVSGVNNVVMDLVNEMMKNNHECVVFYFKDTDNSLNYPCETRKVESWKDKINFEGFNVVHCHGLWPMMNMMLHRYERKNVRFVVTLHCYCFEDLLDLYGISKGTLMGLIYLFCARKFDKIVCLSKHMMAYYHKFLPFNKLSFVYNTRVLNNAVLTKTEEKDIKEFKGDCKLIGMNSVLICRKGIDIMLDALVKLPQEYKLCIVGDGQKKDTFMKLAHKLGIDSRVFFAGVHSNAYRYLDYYDILALPSRSEGFPLTLLEAAVKGITVVVSDLPIVKECFADGKDVIVFRLADGNDGLAEAILKAGSKPSLGSSLHQLYLKDFAPRVFYEGYMKVYEE